MADMTVQFGRTGTVRRDFWEMTFMVLTPATWPSTVASNPRKVWSNVLVINGARDGEVLPLALDDPAIRWHRL